MFLEELANPLHGAREPVQEFLGNHARGAEREQSHERAHLQAHGRPVGQTQHVVEKAVFLVPQFVRRLPHPIHGPGDPEEMLDELERHVLVHRVVERQLQGQLQHVLGIEGHPGGPIRLLQVAARRQGGAAIEHPDVIEAEEPALEDVFAGEVFPVDPPGEVDQQLLEGALEELDVARAGPLLLQGIHEQGGPGVDRRVHIAEVPLVGRDLSIGMEVQIVQHQRELPLGKVGIHHGEGDRVERQIPGRVPGILPLVRHRDDVVVDHVDPFPVPDVATVTAGQRVCPVFIQPRVEVEVVVLLRPEHPGERLPHDVGGILSDRRRRDRAVERIRFLAPVGHHIVEAPPQRRLDPLGFGGRRGAEP